MPAGLRLCKRVVVQVLVFSNFGFEGGIFADIKAVLVQKQRREQAAHSSVSVIEGVDAQKVMDKKRNCNQRFQFHISNHTVVFLADSVQRFRRFIRDKRRKQCFHMTVRIGGSDIILHAFCAARERVIHVAVQDFVKLQNIVLRNWYRVKALMNDTQHIAVSSNFLLVTVSRRGFLLDELPDSGTRGDDALDGI